MGNIAADVVGAKLGGLGSLRHLDDLLLRRALRGAGSTSGQEDLLSYLLYDSQYFAESIEHGRRAAMTALETGWDT